MKLLETYSRNCSVEIKHKPTLIEKFFPLGDVENYITLQTKSGMPAKDYSHFQEIVNILFPVLEKANIKIILLGKEDTQPLGNVIDLRNKTNLGQSCYIVKKSLCHFGVDSWMCHYAGAENVPLVAMYGSTTVANHSPYHYDQQSTIFLESHRNGNKATFAREENPKTVDLLTPEKIASSVCKLLNIPFDYPYKTLRFGSNYNNKMIECIPDQVIHPQGLGIESLFYRMDVLFNEENLFKQLHLCKCSIFTNRPIKKEIITQLKPQIIEVHYEIDNDYDVEFIDFLRDAGVKLFMYSYLGEEELNKAKLDLFDYGIVHRRSILEGKQIKELEGTDLNNIYYKSHKYTLSQAKIYPSLGAYYENLHVDNFNDATLKIIDKPAFWREIEHFYLLTQ